MKNKNTKTILFASLIIAMILPFSGMNFAEATNEQIKEETLLMDSYKYDYLSKMISIDDKAIKEGTTNNGINYRMVVKVNHDSDIEHDVYVKMTTWKESQSDSQTNLTQYTVIEEDGSFRVQVTDSDIEFVVIPEPQTRDVTVGIENWIYSVVTLEETATVDNNYVSVSESYTQSCPTPTGNWSMNGYADSFTNSMGITSSITAPLVHLDYCVFPMGYIHTHMKIITTDQEYEEETPNPIAGMSQTLVFPRDDITFQVKFVHEAIIF